MKTSILVMVFLLIGIVFIFPDINEDLLEAVQNGETGTVMSLLEAGADAGLEN